MTEPQATIQLFRAWVEEAFPDGMGSGNGLSWWTADDMEAAFLAGVTAGLAGQPKPATPAPATTGD